MTKPKPITELFAWVCREPNGGDGIPAIAGPGGILFPLVGADLERMQSLRDHARSVNLDQGYPVRLVRFTSLEVLEEFGTWPEQESDG